MKKLLIRATIIGILIAISGSIFYTIFTEADGYNKSSQQYVEREISTLAKNKWDSELLEPLAHPEMLQNITMAQWQKFANYYWQKLGDLQALGHCEGKSKTLHLSGEKLITAHYNCQASFDNGEAEIKTSIKLDDGEWKFLRIKVNSPVLMQ